MEIPQQLSNEEKLYFARLELKRDINKCITGGFKKDEIVAIADKMKRFQTDFAGKVSQDEIASLAEILKELVRHHNEMDNATPAPTTPTTVTADLARDVPVRTAHAPIVAEITNTSVINSKNFYQDNVVLLYSPFMEELEYVAECYAYEKKMPIRVFDIADIISKFKDGATNLFAALNENSKSATEVIVYKNIEAFEENTSIEENFFYYLRLMRQNCHGIVQLILAATTTYSIEDRYRAFIDKTYKSKAALQTYLKSIPFDFVQLPTKEQTKLTLEKKFELDKDEETTKTFGKNGIFLGYKGLGEAMICAQTTEQLLERLTSLREKRKELLDEFLNALGDSEVLDISDWEYRPKTKKKTPVKIDKDNPILNPKYKMRRDGLYDSLIGNDEIYAKLETIMNYQSAEIPVQAKCAWVADYALKGGDMLNLYNLPPEEAENILAERWNIANRAVAELMRVQVGTMIFDLPEKGTLLGMCCDGGATIRMNKKYVKVSSNDIDRGVETLLHELFHSLQHRAIKAEREGDEELLSYYAVHFGIHHQINEWNKNFSRYRSTDNGNSFADYEDQVVEAEARVFAADCIWKNGMIDHPILD